MHTKGPWEIVPLNRKGPNGVWIHGDGFTVCSLSRRADKPVKQKEADARLIAAAPDLLEALKRCFELQDECLGDHGAVMDLVEAAIAKAESSRLDGATVTLKLGEK